MPGQKRIPIHRILAVAFWLLGLSSLILVLPYWSHYLNLSGTGITQQHKVFGGLLLFPEVSFLELKVAFFSTVFELACLGIGLIYWRWPFQGRWQPLSAATSWLCTLSAFIVLPFTLVDNRNHPGFPRRGYSYIVDPFSQDPLPPELYLHAELSVEALRLIILLALFGFLFLGISLASYFFNKRATVEDVIDL